MTILVPLNCSIHCCLQDLKINSLLSELFYRYKKFRLFRLVHMYVGQDIPLDDLIAQGVNKGTCDQLLQRITGVYAAMAAEKA